MQKKRFAKICLARVHSFFYAIAFTYKVPGWCYFIFWMLERLMVTGPIIMYLLANTEWNTINSYLVYLNILTYFDGGTNQFSIFCYTTMSAVALFLLLFLYRVIWWDKDCNVFLGYFISVGFNFCYRIALPVLAMCTFYTYFKLGTSTLYSPHKKISNELIPSKSSSHIVLLVLMSVTLLAMILMNFAIALLYQTKRFALWCTNVWKIEALNTVLKLVLNASMAMDPNNRYIILFTAVLTTLMLGRIVLRFFDALYWDPLFDVFELGFDCCFFLLECLILTAEIFSSVTTEDCYQYAVFTPVCAFLLCLVKYYMSGRKIISKVSNDNDAIAYMRTILKGAMNKRTGFKTLLGALIYHKNNCARPGCECESLITKGFNSNASKEEIELNYKAYETKKSLPARIKDSWKREVVAFLASEVNSRLGKASKLSLVLAEMAFYCEGNIYQALHYLGLAESLKKTIIFSQYTANLRETMEEGMWKGNKDAVKLMETLNFQRKYDQFLDCIESVSEATVEFWATMNDEKMDIKTFIKHGKRLYEYNYDLIKLAKEINEINPHHLEFLIKYGLYMKLIAHDRITASQVFNKIMWVAEDYSTGLVGGKQGLAAARNECETMIILTSLDPGDFFQIVEANSEIEHQLGYKKEELLRFSANKIIPEEVAKRHQKMVMRFFQNMETKCIGVWTLRFFKHRDEYVVPCMMMVHIVPSLKQGLEAIAVFHVDKGISAHAGGRADKTKGKVSVH